MSSLRLLLALLALSAALAAVHIAALQLYLYAAMPWLDNIVHFFGGVLVAWAFLWSALRFKIIEGAPASRLALLAVFAAGVAWEVFELWAGVPRVRDYAADTALDLAMDLLGGVSGALALRRAEAV